MSDLELDRRIGQPDDVYDPQPGGQYVQQITSAYFLTLPPRAAEMLRRIFHRPTEQFRSASRQRQVQVQVQVQVQAEFEAMPPDERRPNSLTRNFLKRSKECVFF